MGQSSKPSHISIDASGALALITECHNPTLVIDAVDVAGAVAAVNLAKAANIRLDHAVPSHLAPLQEVGFISTMPGEALERSDVVLWVGPATEALKTDETARRLLDDKISVGDNANQKRKHLCLTASSEHPLDDRITTLNFGDRPLIETLGLLRARVNGRPIAVNEDAITQIGAAIEALKSAKYGVAVFCAGKLSFLEQTNLMGLVDDLSSETRWSLLPTNLPPGQAELSRITLALTGLTVPLAFHKGRAQHDAYLHGISETLARGETDLIIWVSSSQRAIPPYLLSRAKTIAITAHNTTPANVAAHVRIGIAGVDHAAVLEAPELGSLVSVTPIEANSNHPPAAEVLNTLSAHFDVNAKVSA